MRGEQASTLIAHDDCHLRLETAQRRRFETIIRADDGLMRLLERLCELRLP